MKECKIQIKDGLLLVIKKVKIKSVIIKKPFFIKKNKTLYNLTIEDDNSFVLNSIMTHNTGQRGNIEWKVYYKEKKPQFTIPIVPLRAKAMHYINESGKNVFLKNSMGQSPQAWMRRAFKDNQKYVGQIWKNEFKDIEDYLKIKDISTL
jgi:hypothetical protein